MELELARVMVTGGNALSAAPEEFLVERGNNWIGAQLRADIAKRNQAGA